MVSPSSWRCDFEACHAASKSAADLCNRLSAVCVQRRDRVGCPRSLDKQLRAASWRIPPIPSSGYRHLRSVGSSSLRTVSRRQPPPSAAKTGRPVFESRTGIDDAATTAYADAEAVGTGRGTRPWSCPVPANPARSRWQNAIPIRRRLGSLLRSWSAMDEVQPANNATGHLPSSDQAA
jgi:hypothetical protein